MRVLWTIALTGALIGSAAASQYDWTPYRTSSTGSWPEAVAIGDVNGDGRNDVVLATTYYSDSGNDYSLFIYVQRTDGTLALPYKYRYSAYGDQLALTLADLDADGAKDIIVGGSNAIEFFVSNGSGGHTSRYVPLEHDCTNAAVLDIDLDGKLDVVAQSWSSGATLLYGDGSGGIRSRTPMNTSAGGYNDMKVGDVTGDGVPDLVIVSTQSEGLFVRPHNGRNGFGSEISYPRPEFYDFPWAVAIADVDHDGRNEVVTSVSANSPNAKLWIYKQNAAGRLAASYSISTYDVPDVLKAHDLDNDGRMDLIVGHRGWGSLGRFMQTAAGLATPELLNPAPINGYAPETFAVGDYSGDGCPDIAIADLNVGLATMGGMNCFEPWTPANQHNADFDGNGRADILWRHAATGWNAIWKDADALKASNLAAIADASWQVAGIGDFDGDRKSDILWRNNANGRNGIWKEGDSLKDLNLPTIAETAWQVAGIGDFNGDGRSDIFWRHKYSGANAIWRSANPALPQTLPAVGRDWRVAGVGDFDGDRQADILWRNTVDGRNAVWKSGGPAIARYLATVADPYWQVAGIGDFDGDRRADILWHHALSMSNAIWKSGNSATQQGVTPVANNSWKVSAIGDFDGNGTSDLLWRNRRTGAGTIWRSASTGSTLPVAALANINWQIAR